MASDRPTLSEIEITDDMIAAGRGVIEKLYLGQGVYAIGDESIRELFLRMEEVRRQSA
jgi:hypothetical protein